ncbi:MAG: biotin/lipoyl-binding protein [Gemmataceae bacterium]|nr:biotin/lipoyl-binding protein [Gemmataceae bacterium]
MNRIWWLLILVLLVGTMAAAWAYYNGFGHSSITRPSMTGEEAPPMVVGLGLIDGENQVAKLTLLMQGRVTEVISEGAIVKKGEPLLKIDQGMYQAAIEEAKAALEEARERLNQAKDLPEQHRLKLVQQQAAIDAAEAERRSVRLDQQSKLDLLKGGVNVNKNLLESLEEKLKQLDHKVAAETARLEEIKLFRPHSEIHRARADVQAKEAQLAKAQWALKQCVLEAPSDGLVLRVSIAPGEILAPALPGQPPPIQFLPAGKKIVRAEIQQEWAKLVKVDDAVDIEDDVYQGPTWKGRVRSLSNWFAEKRNRYLEPYMINDVRTLECLVEVLDDDAPLRIGQRVRVKIKTRPSTH